MLRALLPGFRAAVQQFYERENAATVQQQYEKKLAMLFDHYGIADKKTGLHLCLLLQHNTYRALGLNFRQRGEGRRFGTPTDYWSLSGLCNQSGSSTPSTTDRH
jgi:hypothetical protein